MSRRRAACFASGFLLAASLACGDDSTGPANIEGLYTLRTIGGKPLPVVIAEDSIQTIEVTSSSITLGANSAFTLAQAFRTTRGVQSVLSSGTATGTWARSGSTVTMHLSSGATVPGALSGTTITVNMPGPSGTVVVWIFRK
jgi:hypothetical protein